MSLFIDLGNERLRDTLEVLKNYRIRFVYLGCNPVKILSVLILILNELNQVINKLPRSKCAEPAGYIREIFITGGKSFRRSVFDMTNKIKHSQAPPTTWSNMWVRMIKKKNGSINDLNSYRGVFIGSIVSLTFQKLLNLRAIPYLEHNMAKFRTGGMRGKGVTDNLFILRGTIDHSNYLGKELWISFYDIGKYFDSPPDPVP